MTIRRSTGIEVKVPHMGIRPGGGYSGCTEELDELVQDAAEMMEDEYGDVEIRFNADRRSGKAFIPAGADAQIGLGGWLRPDGELVVKTYIPVELYSGDGMMCDCWNGGNSPATVPNDRYDSRKFETLEQGLEHIRENSEVPQ